MSQSSDIPVVSGCSSEDGAGGYRCQRLQTPRMSLLGKPLHFKTARHRDHRYRRVQGKIYNFLERPRGRTAAAYHVLV